LVSPSASSKIKKLNAKDLSQTSVEEALGDTKGVTQNPTVNRRRTDNTMAKRKRTK
jgi:hypothetical protein